MDRTARRLARSPLALAALVLALAVVFAACGSDEDDAGPAPLEAEPGDEVTVLWDQQSIARGHEAAGIFPTLLNSTRVAWGENRLQFAFFRPDGTLLEHAEVTGRLYRLGEADSRPEVADFVREFTATERTLDYDTGGGFSLDRSREGASDRLVALVPAPAADPPHPHHDGEHVTVYTAIAEFDRMGWWGAELDVVTGDEEYRNLQVRFWVQERTSEPMPGEEIPPSRQLTVHDVDDIADIDTTIPPNPGMHEITVADALEDGRPMVVAFATPAFCATRFCGPIVEQVVVPAWEQYGDDVRFIHIEPYDLQRAREGVLEPTEITAEWGLTVEPIIFVVDAQGRVSAKLEGIVELEELADAIEAVLARTP